MIKKIFFLSFLFFFTCTCNPTYNEPNKYFIIKDKSNYGDLFRAFWGTLHDNYAFDFKTDWYNVYREYSPKARAITTGLDSSGKKGNLNATNQNEFINLLKEVIDKNIIDGHFSLKKVGNITLDYNPLKEKKQKRKQTSSNNYADPLTDLNQMTDFHLIHDIKKPFLEMDQENSEYKNMRMILGDFTNGNKKRILYFHIDSFFLKQGYEKDSKIKELLDNIFQTDSDSIIFDLRYNRGGKVEDIEFFVSRFLTKPITYAYSRFKRGPFLEYFDWNPEVVYPHSKKFKFKKAVLILNKISVSLAETTGFILAHLPYIKFVGEITFGALSPVMEEIKGENNYNKNFNMGGSYDLGEKEISLSVRMGIAAIKICDKNGMCEIREEKGVIPDHELKGNEDQIKKALDLIRRSDF